MGSNTYRGMAARWPNDNSVFAAPMNSIPKIVFSATMHDSIWDETTFIDGDLATAIAELKQQPTDGYLLAHGGAQFVRSLCRTGLIDEVRLLVHPVILGSGQRIFPEPMNLRPNHHNTIQQRRSRPHLPSNRLGERGLTDLLGTAPAREVSR